MKNMNKDIPTNLEEGIQWLMDNVPDDEQQDIANGDLDVIQAHHTLGRWMRNNWGLWQGSELREWFFDKGIHHADDMSGIILESFQRKLCGEDIDFEEQKEVYYKHWKRLDVDPMERIDEIKERERKEAEN